MNGELIGPQRCGGGVARDADGNFIERFACEVHLFTPAPGNCAWQQAVYDERTARRDRAVRTAE